MVNLAHVDYQEAYKFLLKINACKKQYYFIDSMGAPACDHFFNKNKDNENYYKTGIDEIISFADFQKKIEKSIAYIISKAQNNIHFGY